MDQWTTFYAPTIKASISAVDHYGTFLIDTGSMRSLISSAILSKNIQLHNTGVSVSDADDDQLPVLGVTYLDNVPQPQESLFVVIKNK